MKYNKQQYAPSISLLRLSECMRITGYGRSTLWKKIGANEFVKPVPLSDKPGSAVGFPSDLVQEWVQQRIAAASNNKQNPVRNMRAARKSAKASASPILKKRATRRFAKSSTK